MANQEDNPSNSKGSSKYIYYHGLPLSSEAHTKESLEFAENFSVEDTDVFAVTYPKSGTIWMQEILPLLLNGGDLTPIQTIPNWDRVPWLEVKRLEAVVDRLTSPRAFVTHYPYNLMPPSFHTSKAKAIYVMRDPRDILVSSYYFHQMAQFLEEPGTFDEFMGKFLEGKVFFGKWTDHVKSWMHTELGDRLMHITYEEMVQDLPAALRRMSDFLACNLDDETIQKIAKHCSFQAMKENKMSNFSLVSKRLLDKNKSQFLRKDLKSAMKARGILPSDIRQMDGADFNIYKQCNLHLHCATGQSGDWKSHFSSEQLARFTSVIHKELEAESCSLPWSLDTMEGAEVEHGDLESP